MYHGNMMYVHLKNIIKMVVSILIIVTMEVVVV